MQGFVLIVDPNELLNADEREAAVRRALSALLLRDDWEVCEHQSSLAHSATVGMDVEPCHEQRDGCWLVGDHRELRAFGRTLDRSEVAQLLRADLCAASTSGASQLRGPGALAVVDERSKRVLLWRDRLGLRPLFYAIRRDGVMIASNAIDAILATELVDAELDRESLLEFALFSGVQSPSRTSYAAIRRLPPAHLLCTGRRPRRYWEPQDVTEVAVSGRGPVLRAFRSALGAAIEGRLSGPRHAVMMSGGLDSTSVAALVRARRPEEPVDAWTVLRSSLPEEIAFARQAAEALRLHHHQVDEDALFAAVDDNPTRWSCAEPGAVGPWAAELRIADDAVARGHTRVLTGQGGDMLLRPNFDRLGENLRRGQLGRLSKELRDQLLFGERRPPLFVRERLRARLAPRQRLPLPAWLRPELVEKYDLQERWDERQEADRRGDRKLELATGVYWSNLMGMHDPWYLRRPVRFEACFVDDELFELVRSFPEWPWLVDKKVLREAMEDHLPDDVRLRPKTTSEWANDQLRRRDGSESASLQAMSALEEQALGADALAELIDVERVRKIRRTPDKVAPWQYTLASGVVALGWWIRYGSGRNGGSHR